MLERIETTSARGALLDLVLEDLVNGVLLDEVGGLDPVKATISSSSFANLDGSDYQSSRREERNITMHLTLEPEWGVETVRDLRRRLYQFFMPKSSVDLRFYSSDMDPVKISGRVESFESPLFVPEPFADISIMCFDPDFVEENAVVVSGSSVSTNLDTVIDYEGDVETGFLFTLNVNRAMTAFTIYMNGQQMDFAGTLQAGDVLNISTVAGAKYARLTRGGTTSSFLYGVSATSIWHELQPGDNNFRVYATGSPVPYTLSYFRRYGGL